MFGGAGPIGRNARDHHPSRPLALDPSSRSGGLPAVLAIVLALAAGCAVDRTPSSTGAAPTGPGASASESIATPSPTPSSTRPTPEVVVVGARWEEAGTMVRPRVEAQGVLLGDGRVLAVGDVGGKYEPIPEHSREAELWDPATATWRETESLNKARGRFAAATLLDGRALVAGGLNSSDVSYSSAYVFDPRTEHWTKVGLMGTARAHPAAAVLDDGRVLVAGGAYCTGYPAVGQVGVAAPAAYHPATNDRDVRLTDAGPGPDCYALATAELFDPSSGTWSTTGPMRYVRAYLEAVTLTDGRVMVAGIVDRGLGSGLHVPVLSTEIYDPVTGRFGDYEEVPATIGEAMFRGLGLPTVDRCEAKPLSMGTLTAMRDGAALLVNSFWLCSGPHPSPSIDITRAFRFRAATGQWSEVGVTLVDGGETGEWGTRPNGIVAALDSGRVLFAGGFAAGRTKGIRTAALFDPETGDWAALPDMPAPRVSADAVVLADGSVLILGGYDDPFDGYPIPLGETFRLVLSR